MLNGGGVIKRIQGRIEDYIVCKDGPRLKRVELIETTMDKLVTTNSSKFKYIINFIRE